ncbi:MAG: helix-turn-helix transcriptional regulator [Betaproteobacteria bacterium]|nr:helix-turn-helix transcriptional regulator [Betaproteobacteria bacterium]
MDYVIQVPSQLSSHIRALRKAKGLSQAGLGDRMGLSQARIARIESGPLSISVEQFLQVLSALGVRMTLEPQPSTHDSLALRQQTERGTVTPGTTRAKQEPDRDENGW